MLSRTSLHNREHDIIEDRVAWPASSPGSASPWSMFHPHRPRPGPVIRHMARRAFHVVNTTHRLIELKMRVGWARSVCQSPKR